MKTSNRITVLLVVIGAILIFGSIMSNHYELLNEDLGGMIVCTGFLVWLIALLTQK